MNFNTPSLTGLSKTKIRISTLKDWLLVLSIFMVSAHDCLVRLFPVLPYSTISLLLFAMLLFISVVFKSVSNQRAIIFLIIIYFVIGFSYLIASGTQSEYIRTLLLQPASATRLWVFFVAFALIKQPEKWHGRLLWLAYINVFLLAVTALTGRYTAAERVLNYVGLGISAAMWVPIIIQHAFLSKGIVRTLHICGTAISILFVAVYGNRGSLIAILAYVIYCILKYTKVKRKFIIIFLLCVFGWIIYFYQAEIITFIANQVSRFGIYSRNLTLYLNGNLAYTTHRTDEIWVRVMDAIKERPYLGYGLCYDRVLNGAIDVYAHNLVLELFVSFGIPIGGLLLVLHSLLGVKTAIGYMENDWERLLSPFWVTSTVLLMFNNSFCQLGFFWIPYGIYFAYLKNAKLRHLRKIRN